MNRSIIRYFSTIMIFTAVFGILTNFAYAADDPRCEPGKEGYSTQGECADNCIKIGAPAPGEPNCLPKQTAFPQYISMIYTLSITLSIILATIMIIYGGYKYMTSAGNPETLAEAKDIITGAIVGLILLIMAALILRTISPSIVGIGENQPSSTTETETQDDQTPPLEQTTPSSEEGTGGGFSTGGGQGVGGGESGAR